MTTPVICEPFPKFVPANNCYQERITVTIPATTRITNITPNPHEIMVGDFIMELKTPELGTPTSSSSGTTPTTDMYGFDHCSPYIISSANNDKIWIGERWLQINVDNQNNTIDNAACSGMVGLRNISVVNQELQPIFGARMSRNVTSEHEYMIAFPPYDTAYLPGPDAIGIDVIYPGLTIYGNIIHSWWDWGDSVPETHNITPNEFPQRGIPWIIQPPIPLHEIFTPAGNSPPLSDTYAAFASGLEMVGSPFVGNYNGQHWHGVRQWIWTKDFERYRWKRYSDYVINISKDGMSEEIDELRGIDEYTSPTEMIIVEPAVEKKLPYIPFYENRPIYKAYVWWINGSGTVEYGQTIGHIFGKRGPENVNRFLQPWIQRPMTRYRSNPDWVYQQCGLEAWCPVTDVTTPPGKNINLPPRGSEPMWADLSYPENRWYPYYKDYYVTAGGNWWKTNLNANNMTQEVIIPEELTISGETIPTVSIVDDYVGDVAFSGERVSETLIRNSWLAQPPKQSIHILPDEEEHIIYTAKVEEKHFVPPLVGSFWYGFSTVNCTNSGEAPKHVEIYARADPKLGPPHTGTWSFRYDKLKKQDILHPTCGQVTGRTKWKVTALKGEMGGMIGIKNHHEYTEFIDYKYQLTGILLNQKIGEDNLHDGPGDVKSPTTSAYFDIEIYSPYLEARETRETWMLPGEGLPDKQIWFDSGASTTLYFDASLSSEGVPIPPWQQLTDATSVPTNEFIMFSNNSTCGPFVKFKYNNTPFPVKVLKDGGVNGTRTTTTTWTYTVKNMSGTLLGNVVPLAKDRPNGKMVDPEDNEKYGLAIMENGLLQLLDANEIYATSGC